MKKNKITVFKNFDAFIKCYFPKLYKKQKEENMTVYERAVRNTTKSLREIFRDLMGK